ncbi:homocysteine S-methyltransferase family protein [uncultured Tateyamaria sp.]|uniref:homocysteine S-methyltransferase family protein n=1 Tax=uncultured Tateyamaria sp. TaxID=455651 RepID=UPI00262653AB|nr:homocysteine S-methyltransferase family protein [uncultured Tateyamaria sp.]
MTVRLLPHQTDRHYLVYAGTGTDLIFNRGIDLPGFASFPLVQNADTRAVLVQQMRELIEVAQAAGLGAIIDTPTWTANRDRAAGLGYSADQLIAINQQAVIMMRELRDSIAADNILLALCLGPGRDPYGSDDPLSVEDARAYHRTQIETVKDLGIDLVNAYTFNKVDEAAGAVLAAKDLQVPVALSLVVETDGKLDDGTPVADAVARIDTLTQQGPAYYMINCVHPDHFAGVLSGIPRLKGLVANASRCAHAELDEATTLDDGDPSELGAQIAHLAAAYPALNVLGGCCGTDMRHMRKIAEEITT